MLYIEKMKQTTDHRTEDTEKPRLWAVATDRVLSHWRSVPGTSYVAYPIYSYEDQRALIPWMEQRSDYIRVRVNLELPRLRNGARLSLYDRPRHVLAAAAPRARMCGEQEHNHA